MKNFLKLLFICLFFSYWLVFPVPCMAELTAEEIMQKADDVMDPGDFVTDLVMSVKRPDEDERVYKMKMNGGSNNDKMLITFHYPPRDKGQAFLKVGDNMWVYLPKLNKTLRIPKQNSFAGGDFSNNDVLTVRFFQDYTAERLKDEKIDNVDCYCLKLTARSKSATYASILYWINKKNFWPIKRVFYSLGGKPLKTLLIKSESGTRPDTFVMSNVMEKDKISIMHWANIKKTKHNPKIFTEAYLLRRR